MNFSSAYKKVFVGTKESVTEVKATVSGVANTLTQAGIDNGFITSSTVVTGGDSIKTKDLQSYGMGPGTFGFFDKNYEIVQSGDLSANGCCPMYLVAASLRTEDQLGDFHSGYSQSKKSVLIESKNVLKVYRVDECTGRSMVVSMGTTPYTSQDAKIVTGLETLVGGTNYVTATDVVVTGGTGTGLTIDITASALAGAGAIATFTITTAGTGYTTTDFALIGGSGTSARVEATAAVGPITVATVNAEGTDYEVGDVLTVAGGNGDAILTVATVTEAGGIISVATINNPGEGYTVGDTLTIVGGNGDATVDVATIAASIDADTLCAKEFYCGEVYNFGIEVKGSPALRTHNRTIYENIGVSTGCCSGEVPSLVDPTLVYIDLATQITENINTKYYVTPVVFDYTGTPWYAPGTTETLDGTGTAVTAAQYWTAYEGGVTNIAWNNDLTSGMRLYGSYVDTKFKNCSFKQTDHFEKEPVIINAYLTDLDGLPCEFSQICTYVECEGLSGSGYGESVIRDFLLDDKYETNTFFCDPRMREVMNDDSVFDTIDREAMYTNYFIYMKHERHGNPSSTFDNDYYLLQIVTPERSTSLETFLETWLDTGGCSSCYEMDTTTVCADCDLIPDSALV